MMSALDLGCQGRGEVSGVRPMRLVRLCSAWLRVQDWGLVIVCKLGNTAYRAWLSLLPLDCGTWCTKPPRGLRRPAMSASPWGGRWILTSRLLVRPAPLHHGIVVAVKRLLLAVETGGTLARALDLTLAAGVSSAGHPWVAHQRVHEMKTGLVRARGCL
jgi:hypothetical protein